MKETYADADHITYATFDDLIDIDPDDNAADVTLPSGMLVRARGLTRHELLMISKGADGKPELYEARMVSHCLLKPSMVMAQVQAWQRVASAGGDFRVLTEAIRELSGLSEGADKSDPGEPGE